MLDITWTQNANINGLDTWANQLAWAAGYSQTHSVHGTFDDWRLPSMDLDGNNAIVDCANASEESCRDNELGYLRHFHGVQPGASSLIVLPLSDPRYWSGTTYPSIPQAWLFDFQSGYNGTDSENSARYALAVREGDIAAVPEPSSALLLGLGLLGLGTRQARGKRHGG